MEVGDPFSCSFGRRGRHAQRGAPGAQCRTLGVGRLLPIPSVVQGRFALRPVGGRSLFRWN
eukprot:13579724-Alexandrium_andersonii.AAC.1